MISAERERRKFRRVLFSKEDEIVASVTFQEIQKGPLRSNILNMSEGGVCLILKKDAAFEVNRNDVLFLTEVKGITPELSVDALKMKVRWVMDEEFFEHVQIGCEFLNASNKLRAQIRQIEANGVISSTVQ